MLKSHSLKPAKIPEPPEEEAVDILQEMLAPLSDSELLTLRQKIEARLKIEIRELNLTEELGLQYRQGKLLLEQVINDKSTPANQKAQVFNSISAMTEKIMKQLKIVYSAERLNRYEKAFIKILKTLPQSEQDTYFDLYGEFLNDKGA